MMAHYQYLVHLEIDSVVYHLEVSSSARCGGCDRTVRTVPLDRSYEATTL